jgi:hypothetical protein
MWQGFLYLQRPMLSKIKNWGATMPYQIFAAVEKMVLDV